MNKPKTIRTKVGWQHCKKCDTVISNRTAKVLGGLCAHCWATTMAQYIELGIKHMVIAVVILAGTNAWAVEIDLGRIAQIESSNNPKAFNPKSGAVGLYQITSVCLKDYNLRHLYGFNLDEMYEPHKAHIVANWYLTERIPQMLRHYKLPDSVSYRLISYNWGIGNLIKHHRNGVQLPKETRDYIMKYNKGAK